MIVVAMFLFIQIWNDLLQQMIYINTEDKFTISMGLSQLKGSLGFFQPASSVTAMPASTLKP